jgi:putative aminopeptidase FrvX
MFSKKSIKTFERISLQPGVSNYEIGSGISNLIFDIVKKISSNSKMDKYGNVISIIGGGRKEIIIDTHLDEFGFYVQKNKNSIYIKPIGSFNYQSIKNQQAQVINKNISGRLKLIDNKTIEFIPEENNDITKILKNDFIIFKKTFQIKERSIVKATSLDNRVGCFLATEIMKKIKNKLPNDLSVKFVFSAGEESGKFLLNKVIKKNNSSVIIIDAAYAEPVKFTNAGGDVKIPKIGNGCAIQTRGKNFVIKKDIIKKIEKLAFNNKIKFQKEIPPPNQGQTNLSGLKIKNKQNCLVINVPVKNQHEKTSECDIKDIQSALDLVSMIVKNF